MVDEKRDKGDSGLQDSASCYICTLCYADKYFWKNLLASFYMNRTVSEFRNISQLLRVNPDM